MFPEQKRRQQNTAEKKQPVRNMDCEVDNVIGEWVVPREVPVEGKRVESDRPIIAKESRWRPQRPYPFVINNIAVVIKVEHTIQRAFPDNEPHCRGTQSNSKYQRDTRFAFKGSIAFYVGRAIGG
ncbi:MAG: hypothetical protein VXZ82_11620 [Planctomycetota bacterium]|nr:hypothetical protein [Planctomycetota bacterium]